MFAPLLGGCNPRVDALDNQRALEFRQRAHDMEHELSARCRGVDAFRQRGEARATRAQMRHRLNEMRQRSPEPVELPHDQHIIRADLG